MSRKLYNFAVVCRTRGCENAGVPIRLGQWDGATVICGPCGRVIKEQTVWHVPPSQEGLGLPSGPEQAAGLINGMTPAERAALIALLTGPVEGEPQ